MKILIPIGNYQLPSKDDRFQLLQEMIDVNTFYEEMLAIRDYIKAVRSNPLQYV